jgi:hypothetical protein
MKKFGTVFFLITGWMFLSPMADAQNVSVNVQSDSSHITIGDWFRVSIEVKRPDNVKTYWPAFKDSLGPFDLVKQDSLTTSEANGIVTEEKTLTVSKYDSGSFSLPAVQVAYTAPGDTAMRYAQSSPLIVSVSSIAVDTSKAIKDIKGPLSVPLTWRDFLLYALILLAIAAIIYGIYYYRKKHKKGPEEVEEIVEERPAHLVAVERLRELEEKRLWQQGDVKKFYSDATEIIREYFEKRYGIMALELTSDEVVQQLMKFRLDAALMRSVESLFLNADLVKFAKYAPVSSENEAVIPQALQIVEQSKPRQEPVVTGNV